MSSLRLVSALGTVLSILLSIFLSSSPSWAQFVITAALLFFSAASTRYLHMHVCSIDGSPATGASSVPPVPPPQLGSAATPVPETTSALAPAPACLFRALGVDAEEHLRLAILDKISAQH